MHNDSADMLADDEHQGLLVLNLAAGYVLTFTCAGSGIMVDTPGAEPSVLPCWVTLATVQFQVLPQNAYLRFCFNYTYRKRSLMATDRTRGPDTLKLLTSSTCLRAR